LLHQFKIKETIMDATDVDPYNKKKILCQENWGNTVPRKWLLKLNFQKHNFRALNYRNRNSTHVPIEATFIYKSNMYIQQMVQ
jgi:hypothetical protein